MLLDRKFQLRLTLQIVGMVYFYLVLFSLITNLRPLRTLIFQEGTETEYLVAVERLRVFVGLMALPLVLTLVCVCLHSILFSHRLAGPLHRIREIIRQVRRGKIPSTVELRRHDYFQDLCEDLDALCGQLRSDMKRCHRLSHDLADAGEALAHAGELTPETRGRLLEMANATQQLRKVVESYHVGGAEPAESGNALEPTAIPAK
jgi:methyl-accepting chemotaxis protein